MRLALRAGAVMVAVLMALVFAEVMLRATGLASPGGVATMTARQFERLPGIYAPNQRVVSRDIPALAHRVTTDSLGYRGADFPRVKPRGEFRVLFTGDSFTYGSYVDDSVTVPALVQAQLGSTCPGVRVVNAGLGGSTITDQAQIVQRGLAINPDVVVVMFSENDVTDLAQPPMWDRLAANRRRKSHFPASLIYGVLRHTALWNLVLRSKARFDGSRVDSPRDAESAAEVSRELRARYRSALRALRDDLASRGIPLIFAAMPTHLTLSGTQSDEQYAWALDVADSLGLPRIGILAAMRRSGSTTGQLYLVPKDGHTSALGNRLAATSITNQLTATLRGCVVP